MDWPEFIASFDLPKENTIQWGWLAEAHTGRGSAYWVSYPLNANEVLEKQHGDMTHFLVSFSGQKYVVS